LLFSNCATVFNIVPRDLPVHYYVFFAIQKVHFIIFITLAPL